MNNPLFSIESLAKYDFDLDIVDTLASRHLRLNKIKTIEKDKYVESNGRTLSYIAYDIYGDVNYWTLLAIYNDIVDPFIVPSKIYYPSIEEIRMALG